MAGAAGKDGKFLIGAVEFPITTASTEAAAFFNAGPGGIRCGLYRRDWNPDGLL